MSSAPATAPAPRSASAVLPSALALGLATLAYRDLLAVDTTLVDPDVLLEWFTRPTGLWFPLVLAGSAFLARRRAAAFSEAEAAPGRGLAIAALLLSGLAFAWARLTGVTDLQVWSFGFGALGAAAWCRGAQGARRMTVPILFLLFALSPPPRLVGEALWAIQSHSARATTALIQALGAPVLVEGIVLSTPTRVFGIVESCAALGMLIVLTALALLLREGIVTAGRRSWLLVLLAPLLALGVNLARMTSIVFRPELNEIHHVGQWAILGVLGGALLLGVRALLGRGSARPGAGVAGLSSGPRPAPVAMAALAVLAALSLVPIPPALWQQSPPPLAAIATEQAGWTSSDAQVDRTFLGLVQFRRIISRSYTRDEELVELFVGDGVPRHPGASPFSAKTILPGLRWVPLPVESDRGLPQVARAPDQTALVARGGERWWVAQWRFGDPGVVRESLRQLFALDASPFSPPLERRVVRIAAPLDPDRPDEVDPARDTVAAFARDFEAELFGSGVQGLGRDSR